MTTSGVYQVMTMLIFEMLTLEGAQAGLSWNIVLAKREGYQKAFQHFDIEYCSKQTDEELETIKELIFRTAVVRIKP